MKLLSYMVASLILGLTLVLYGCQVSPETGNRIGGALEGAVSTVDYNRDGIITNDEVSNIKTNPMIWVGLANVLLSLFGIGKANQATAQANLAASVANKAQVETDELWEKTHKPVAQ